MDLILLGGNNVKNKEWIESVSDCLKDFFENVKVYYYRHWKSGNGKINMDTEAEKLANFAKGDFVVFAKSAGIGTTLISIKKHGLKPKKCIFVGFPLSDEEIKSNKRNSFFVNYNIETLFIQQTQDSYTSFYNLKVFLERQGIYNYVLKEVEGDDHMYDDVEEIKNLVEDFL